MMYNTRDYCDFWTLSIVQYYTTLQKLVQRLGLTLSNGPHRAGVFRLRAETDSVSETACYLEYRTMGKKPINPDWQYLSLKKRGKFRIIEVSDVANRSKNLINDRQTP
jgi:hypothetical protein